MIEENPKCKNCKHCTITTSKHSGAWGKDVWVKHYCEQKKISVNYSDWCSRFIKNKDNDKDQSNNGRQRN